MYRSLSRSQPIKSIAKSAYRDIYHEVKAIKKAIMIEATKINIKKSDLYEEISTDMSPSSNGFLHFLLSIRSISSRFQLLFSFQGKVLMRYSPVRQYHLPILTSFINQQQSRPLSSKTSKYDLYK